jgi:site-specific DNA recombinase
MQDSSPSSQPPRSSVYIESAAELSPAGSYDRQSEAPRAYDSFSPENQRRLNHQAAARDGEYIPPEFEFSDLDLSGRKDVYRPGFEKALRALLDGRIKTLYVAKLDRLTRKGMRHVGLMLDELERVGGRIVFVAEGLDTSKQGARQVIAILAEQARGESDAISWRIGEWHAHNRRMGLWKAKRPFGYLVVDGKLKPHPVEAPIVRRVVEDFLDGATLRSIARRLNDEGIKPPRVVIWYEEPRARGHRVKKPQTTTWSWNGVKKLLTQPVLAGLVSHKRKLVYDENGDLVFAGEGIITVAERARILAEIERRSTMVRHARNVGGVSKCTGGGRLPKYLLSGFTRCGECGGSASIWTQIKRPSRHVYRYYRCSQKAHGQDCRGSFFNIEPLHDEVVSRLRAKLTALEPGDPLLDEIAERWFAQRLPDQEADRRVLEEVRNAARARIADLYAARYERGEFSTRDEIGTYENLMERLRGQRDAAEEALAKLPPRPEFDVATLLDGELSTEVWPTLPLARQRFLLDLAIHQVWIYSTDVPVDERIVIVWHSQEPPAPRRDSRKRGLSPDESANAPSASEPLPGNARTPAADMSSPLSYRQTSWGYPMDRRLRLGGDRPGLP